MSGLDISKDHSPCPRSPVKLNTVKSKRCRQESFTLNPSKSKWSSKSRIDEEENDDIDADEAMLEKIEATPTERTGYVSQTAVALQCRAMPPPCLKNPNVMNQSETDTDPFGYQRSKCANFLPARLSGDGLSRYLTDFHEIQQIGAGHFSRVFKVLKRIDGCLYAVKHSTKKFFLDSERKTVFGLIDQLFLCESQKKWNSTAPSDENSDQNSIDAGSSMWKPIGLLWPGMYHSPVTNALWEARRNLFENPNGDESHSKLTAKSPSRSRTSILYKFSSDFVLREQYRNPWNEIRTGKLVEDLDALAGTISFKHCSGERNARSMILVTASVDRIIMKRPIRVDTDLSIVGAVTWVGRSSMEMQLQVIQSQDANHPSETVALEANFTFVARDAETGKSTPINQVLPETEHEKLLWKEAEERNKLRKQKREQSKEEHEKLKDIERLNELLAEGRVFLDMPALADWNSILIKDTSHEYSLICQPQQRNIHGRIFGGFLMRKAFELAFSNAYTFAGVAPRFLEVDRVDFIKPVDVGNFLRFKSRVLYTEANSSAEPLINIEVVAHVTSPELRCSEVSNKFYFTFSVRPEAMKDGLRIRNVVPATEEEARRVIERMDADRPITLP